MRTRKVPPRFTATGLDGVSPFARPSSGPRPRVLAATAAPPSLSRVRRDKGAGTRDTIIVSSRRRVGHDRYGEGRTKARGRTRRGRGLPTMAKAEITRTGERPPAGAYN